MQQSSKYYSSSFR